MATRLFLSTFISLLFLCVPPTVLAHDIIPAELQEYIAQNPQATPLDIKAFVNAQDPVFARQFENGEQILIMARAENIGFSQNVLSFVRTGITHILSGADHVLFILILLLIFVSMREILKVTATFTLAHSITLLLSGFGVIALSPRITEPLIAFSIAYVAITSVFLAPYDMFRNPNTRLVAVFFFGLFHGLGFVSFLQEIHIPHDKFLSSLFAFNVGIEIGQLVVIAIALPCIYFFRDKSWYGLAVRFCAGFVAALALFWMMQRIFS